MTNRQVWIFKEGRSGSTWFCKTLSSKINRPALHFEKHFGLGYHDDGIETFKNNIDKLKDAGTLYASHYLHLLEYSNLLDPDSVFIRTTRRNKAEHCMSKLTYKMLTALPKHYYVNGPELDYSFKPVTILKQEVKKSMEFLKKHDDYWKNYAKDFDNFVVAYEDLYEGVTIPQLDVSIKFADNMTFTKKLPYGKEKLFANYDQIVEWCNSYEKELGFTEI